MQQSRPESLTSMMLLDIRKRFASVLQCESMDFNPIPAASCLVDPTLASVLFTPEMAGLLQAAKMYVLTMVEIENPSTSVTPATSTAGLTDTPLEVETPSGPSALKKFKYLATKLSSSSTRLGSTAVSANLTTHQNALGQINR
jgi:hypothetical protein